MFAVSCFLAPLLCVLLLQQAQGQSTLTITADSRLQLYINGNERLLANGGDWSQLDNVPLAASDRLIAFHAQGNSWCSGVIASTMTGDLLTGYAFRCTENLYANWNQLGYDDLNWRFSYIVGDNTEGSEFCPKWQQIPQIHSEASWIWTANQTDDISGIDSEVYCRGYLPVCQVNPCLNGGHCNPNGADSVCDCLPGYTGQICETHLEQMCGDLLRPAPPEIAIHPRFDIYCYIGLNDTNYLDHQCRDLVLGLLGFPTSADLLAGGGNFGCWLARTYPDVDLPYACVDNYQHHRALGSCLNCQFMGVCIRYPLNAKHSSP
jgi:hypothetical protein